MRVLVANRGEIAVRLIKGCRELGFHSTAIYSREDASAPHVRLADNAVSLEGDGSPAYLDCQKILKICQNHSIEAVIPGYGLLSENSGFAQSLQDANVIFVGPTSDSIQAFGLKHSARELATIAKVPVVPGTGIIATKKEALDLAEMLGYPVMVKATAGGGGMGLQICRSASELNDAVENVRSRGATLFQNAGFFLERFVENSRHIEGQIFGNGLGDILWFGERECSIQRRNQKILEESPSPFVTKSPELRHRLKEASVALARSINYKSVGTVEFLVDDETGAFYFLEMNTRLQVEHGVTELCYDVDLVQLMLLQAEAELKGQGGLKGDALKRFERTSPCGNAIEVRIYAEKPALDFRPSPGLLTNVEFPVAEGIRVDSWVDTGTLITPSFDPLLAKLMVHQKSRGSALQQIYQAIAATVLQGTPTNLDFLKAVVKNKDVQSGDTTTNLLSSRFSYNPFAIELKDGGIYTTIQDLPGRVGYSNGIPVSGPMDGVSFRISNMLVGNEENTEAFEITQTGPQLVIHGGAIISLCGADFEFTINGEEVAMWTRHIVPAGSTIAIGRSKGAGCRAYLAVFGGLPTVGRYLGSKSTNPTLGWGGYQGRTLRAGDFLFLDNQACDQLAKTPSFTLPVEQRPNFEHSILVNTLAGPYDSDEFLASEGRRAFYDTTWKAAFNSSRTGIRLQGPSPLWSRDHGGEGGSHPSNMLGYGYPIGGLSFTGDSAVVFAADSPGQSGFICLHTVITSQLWKMGQLSPGDEVKFSPCSWKDALALEKRLEKALADIKGFIAGRAAPIVSFDSAAIMGQMGTSVLFERSEGNAAALPRFVIRQAGDRGLLCDYGSQVFDLNYRARAQGLVLEMRDRTPHGFETYSRPHTNSVLVLFNPTIIDQDTAVATLVGLEKSLQHIENLQIPSRIFRLPFLFDAEECMQATKRYMETQRPYAVYLPDNIDFMRRNNGLERREDVYKSVAEVEFLVLTAGGMMGLPILVQIDPRLRLTVPKTNPSRTVTPAGALGTGGVTSSIYPIESPGGYLLWGLTLPGSPFDVYGRKPGFSPNKPWLFEPFDRVVFHGVTRADFDSLNESFLAGMYAIPVEEGVFDLSVYNDLVEKTRVEVAQIRERQQRCAAVELERENELLRRWAIEKEEERFRQGVNKKNAALQIDASLANVTANVNGRVWEIVAKKDSIVKAGDKIVVLEAMKMEISIQAPLNSEEYTLGTLFVKEGDVVDPGDVLATLKPCK